MPKGGRAEVSSSHVIDEDIALTAGIHADTVAKTRVAGSLLWSHVSMRHVLRLDLPFRCQVSIDCVP